MIISKEEWDKRTDNTAKIISTDKLKHNIRRWGGDYSLKFLENNDGKVVYKDLEQLEFPDGSIYKPSEKSMAHVLINVANKPKTNKWSFELENGEDLAFVPQGELTQEQISRGDIRPSYIIDSLAVYKQNGAKLFHIPRAWAKDANGDWTWGKLERKGNIITKVIPQEWLDKATYPIIVDTNVGYESAGGSMQYSTANDMLMSHVISGRDGNITGITWYVSQHTDTYKECTFAVYNAYTGALIAEEAGGLLTTTATEDDWVERTPDNPSASVAITESQAIRVAMWSDKGYQRTHYDAMTTCQTLNVNTPDPGSYSQGSCDTDVSDESVSWYGYEIVSAYVVVTLSSGGSSTAEGAVSVGF